MVFGNYFGTDLVSADTLWAEYAARAFEPPRRRWETPGDLARHINPKTVNTRALELIDEALVEAANTPDSRLIISMPPQEGKSVRVAGDFPTWWLTQNPEARIVVASYGQSLAMRNGRTIRARIVGNPDLGLRIADDNGAAHEWTLAGHEGGVFSVGVGTGLTGRPADLMIIDDPIKDRKEADSEVYRENVWDWWTNVAATRLAPGAPVIIILTRWHHDDLAGRLLSAEDGDIWKVLNIPAQASHKPEDGETDPLDRDPGEFMYSARGRTVEQWEAIKVRSGARTWASLYQGSPSPDEGGIFNPDWWNFYDVPQWIERSDGVHLIPDAQRRDIEIFQSWDMTFKDTKNSDFVVGQVWMRQGVRAILLDQVRGRWSFSETCTQVVSLSTKWPQAVAKLVEDKANGPAVMNALRATIMGFIPVEPEGSKYARASAVSPLVQSGNVEIPHPSLAAWVGSFVEEAKAFPTVAHDDQVDAMSQAVNRLLLVPMLNGDLLEDEDILAEEDDFTGISPW